MKNSLLYYVYDPMCSWCWAFHHIWQSLSQALEEKIPIEYVLGGLAPDTDAPMPIDLQLKIQNIWIEIERLNGTHFNHTFWQKNTPRRSTYPACRAMLAARNQQAEQKMLLAVQRAYYQDALNPSDYDILISLAGEISLEINQFTKDIHSQKTQLDLLMEIKAARMLDMNSFPGLLLYHEKYFHPIKINFLSADPMLCEIEKVIEASIHT